MAANPTAYVRLITVTDSPNDPAKFRYMVTVCGLNIGPVQEDELEVDVPNTALKSATKTAIDNAIIALFAAKGYAILASRIITIADLAG